MPELNKHLSAMGSTVSTGQKIETVITAERMNGIMNAIRALARGENLTGGLGIQLKSGPSGVIMSSNVRGGGGSSDFTILHPFKITDATDDESAQVSVRTGTCQDIEPDGIDAELVVEGDETYTVYLDVEVDIDGEIVGVSLEHSSDGQPEDSDYHGYISLGTVVTEEGAITEINQFATHSLRMVMCGRASSHGSLDTRGTYDFRGF